MFQDEDSRTDTELLRAFQRGEAAALERLVARYRGALHGYLRSMTGSQADADDLFQETWMRVIRNPGSFRDGAFNAWLWRITRNLLIDRLRRLKPTVSLDDATAEGTALVDLAPSLEAGPPADLDAAEVGRRVAEAVARLPPDQRDVFLMRTQGGLSFAAIAALRKVPLNTALGRMHYALQRLRRELGDVYALVCGRAVDAAVAENETAPMQTPRGKE